jgi:hypothetical protein
MSLVRAPISWGSRGRPQHTPADRCSSPNQATDGWRYEGSLARNVLADTKSGARKGSLVALVKPLLRAAIVKLAAIRFTSYSKGPGSVSSKSFRSKSSLRSGDANTPKLER